MPLIALPTIRITGWLSRRQPRDEQEASSAQGRDGLVVSILLATERGRLGYQANTRDFVRLIWETASPTWQFDDAIFARSATAFENPDHVAITVHNYRWRLGLVEGEPASTHSRKYLPRAR